MSHLQGRFLGVDKGAGRTLHPMTWNRYTYALDNPLKLVDPDGLAAVGFTGLGNFQGGVTRLVSQVNGAPGIGEARAFRHQDVSKAVSFLVGQHNAHPGEATVIFGHSQGAASALKAAGQLNKLGIKVDLVLTMDRVDGTKTVPPNVEKAYNYYETKDSNPFLTGTQLKAESPATDLTNSEMLGVTHTQIDDAVADSGAGDSQIREVGARHVQGGCGDPGFVGPCAQGMFGYTGGQPQE